MIDNERYYSPKDAAAYLRTSPSTLAKRRLYGTGPRYCRIGRAIRYRKSDLDEFMAANTVSSTSDCRKGRAREAI
jgi:predicted DNA-binding transcriptional regulator AlpA